MSLYLYGYIIRIIQYLHIGCFDLKVFHVTLQHRAYYNRSAWRTESIVERQRVVGHLSWIVFHYYVKYFFISNFTSITNLYAFFRGISQMYTGVFLYLW
jgi:hypothetical protein